LASIKITLIKSLIGRPEKERKTAKAMGLRKLNAAIIRPDTPEIRGQARKLAHLVRIEEIK